MNSYEISEKFYALFFNGQKDFRIRDYLDNSFCDDILDVDLKKNAIKSLCHVENKYAVITSDGSYTDTYNFVARNIVYPEDREIYEELMNPSHLKERQEKSKTPNFRFAQFRNKLANGRYKWVEQVVLSGKENRVPKDHYIVYVFDIENMKNKEYGLSVTKDSSAFPKDIDENTGLLKEQSFFKLVDEALKAKTIKKPCIVNLDIEHFKFFDEWNGREVGDRLLKQVAAVLKKIADKHKGIVGYMGQDDFVLLLPFDMKCFNRIYDSIKNVILSFGFSFGFNPAIGVALIEEDVPSFVYDKASIACSMSKKNAKERITVYEAEFHSQTEREFKVILEFINALKNNEITFYLQPQCRISTKRIVGLEALTRWIKKDGTVISPSEFIPVLEKYGFITDLDKYIWEKV